MSLNKQQRKFIAEYIKTLDARGSAIKAGYSAGTAAKTAETLLAKEYVLKEIEERLRQKTKSLEVSKAYLVHKFLEIAEYALQEEEVLDKNGLPTGKWRMRDTSAGLKALEALCKQLDTMKAMSSQNENTSCIKGISGLDIEKI